ncbi:MAG: HAMP domain-containing histidine kinase [Epsilonproteobacteria bacterium]|nr:HAMP domain-containing histidine kinase [Campylobacterota bacterium]
MFSQKSIKRKFLIQLVVASVTLIVIFSIILYNYIKISILDDTMQNLKVQAVEYIQNSRQKAPFSKRSEINLFGINQKYGQDKTSVVIRVDKKEDISYEQYEKEGHKYLSIFHVFNPARSSYLKIERDVTGTHTLLSNILKSIILVNFLTLFLILAYAMFLSETLLHPVKSITRRLARMNENFLEHIETDSLPDEFVPLGESINKLIDRIQNFVKYQKELFIGTAHELKTPLAVMKAKNEVTLMRDRDPAKYQDTLKLNNTTIDEMNSMISSILEIGRQEGAQFEKPVEIDLVQFLKDKSKDFTLIAKNVGKDISGDFEPQKYCIISQPTLLTHILQNFVQNAVKFTPDGGIVMIKSRLVGDDFKIEILDEGPGIDETQDLFAPFKRLGNQGGAGLGLFLAKGAADAIGAELSLKNRTDTQGAVATVILNSRNYCPVDDDPKNSSIFNAFMKDH